MDSIRSRRNMLAGAVLTLALAALPVFTSYAAAQQDDLGTARDATGKYWDVQTAMTEGFLPAGSCQSSAAGSLGIRYQHVGRSGDQVIDASRPEALVYLPQGMGAGRRLAAVEYSVPARDGQEPPELFGRRFEEPTPGEAAPRYRLRVWLYSPNPSGLFAAGNPDEACGAEALVSPHGVFDSCRETTLSLPAPAARVREIGAVPNRLRLLGEEAGVATVSIAVFRCRNFTTEQGIVVPDFTFVFGYAQLMAPDWTGADDVATRYPLHMVTHPVVAASWRHGMGADTTVIGHDPELTATVTPLLGAGTTVALTSSEMRLRATAVTPPPVGLPVWVRALRPGDRGMGTFSAWVRDARSGTAIGTVQLRADSLLSRILGCSPTAADPGWCAPKAAAGLNIVFGHAVYRTDARQHWWSPATS